MRDPWGHFTGPVQAMWLTGDSRRMRLLAPVVFVDSRGIRWEAVAGAVSNGASVPWFFRRIFPAYIGKYRRATVVHDVACGQRDRPSREVHQMFYEAMRCDGVGPIQAWLMWAAVRVFGPRFAGTKETAKGSEERKAVFPDPTMEAA